MSDVWRRHPQSVYEEGLAERYQQARELVARHTPCEWSTRTACQQATYWTVERYRRLRAEMVATGLLAPAAEGAER